MGRLNSQITEEINTNRSSFRQEMRETNMVISMHMANKDTFQVSQRLPGVV